MTKIIVNIKLKVRRVVLVSLSLPLGLYGVYLAQPKATSEKYNKAIKNRPQKAWAGLANARLLLRRYIYKRRIIVTRIVFLLFTSIFSVFSHSADWSGFSKVVEVYPHGGIPGVFIKLDTNVINPDNCPKTDWYFMAPETNQLFSEVYSLLLAANKSGSSVNLLVGGCGNDRPYIIGARGQ